MTVQHSIHPDQYPQPGVYSNPDSCRHSRGTYRHIRRPKCEPVGFLIEGLNEYEGLAGTSSGSASG